LSGIQIELFRKRLRRDALNPCRGQRVQAAKINA
jgi:hypothetical protein